MNKLTNTVLSLLAIRISDVPHSVFPGRALLLVSGFICWISSNDLAMASGVHQAHIHGVANMTLAYESGTLEMEFEAPAMSLLGFEHQPRTNEQLETIENTKLILNSSKKIISIDGANCSASSVDVDIHGPAGQALKTKEAHAHDHDEQQMGHDVSHSEVIATYQFDCVDGEKIRSISITFFDAFPSLETISVNWVTETKQGQTTLRSTSSTIELQ